MKLSCCIRGGAGVALLCGFVEASRAQLRLDFNDRSGDLPLHTQEEFDTFVIGATGSSTAAQTGVRTLRYGTVSVTLWDTFGSTYDDRRRTTVTNSGAFTRAPLLED